MSAAVEPARPARRRPVRVGLLLASALGAVVVLGLAACSSDEERRAEHEARAEEYLAEGKANEALLELRNALRLDPQSSDLNFRIATVLYERGQFVDAAFFYGEAARLDPQRTDAPLRQAMIELHRDVDVAEELVDGVLAREPANAEAYLVRSQALLFRSDTEAALRAALTAVELAPGNSASLQQLGKVHQARIREAQLQGEQADDAVFEAAVSAFTRAAELAGPGARVQVVNELASVQAAWPGHADEAEASYREVLGSAEELQRAALTQVLGEIVAFARQTGRPALVADALEVWVSTRPDMRTAWTSLARFEKARSGSVDPVLERLQEARGDDPRAVLTYAAILAEDGRRGEAVDYLLARADGGEESVVVLATAASILQDSPGQRDRLGDVVARMEREHPDHPRTVLARAQLDLSEGRAQEAAEALRALTGRTELQAAWYQLALAEYALRDRAASLDAVNHAVELAEGGPMPLRALLLRARLEVDLGDCVAGLRTLTTVSRSGVALMPPHRLMQAACLYEIGRPRAGRALLEPLVESQDPYAPAVLEYVSREAEARPDEVRAALERAVAASPEDARLQARLAVLEVEEGRSEEALARINQVIASGSADAETLYLRARLLARRGDWAAAQRDALLVFEQRPGLGGLAEFLVRSYREQGNESEAIASFEEARAAGALRPSGRYLLARLYLAAGDDASAREILEQVVVDAPNLAAAKNDLAYLLARQGDDLDRALELAREAEQGLGERPETADTLGFVYLQRGLHEPAAQQFRQALERGEPDSAGMALVHHHLGLALRGLGEYDEAAAEFERALALDASLEDAARELESLRGEAEAQAVAPASS